MWARDYVKPETQAAFSGGGYQQYINGFPAGRMSYLGLAQHLNQFLGLVWASAGLELQGATVLNRVYGVTHHR